MDVVGDELSTPSRLLPLGHIQQDIPCGKARGDKGWFHLQVYKKKLLDEIVGPLAESLSLCESSRTKLRALRTGGFPTYMDMFGGPGNTEVDMSWLGMEPDSGRQMLHLAAACFKPTLDHQISPKLQSLKSPAECLASDPFDGKLNLIKEALETEASVGRLPASHD